MHVTGKPQGWDVGPSQSIMHALIHTYDQYRAVTQPPGMFSGGGGKPENPEETQRDPSDITNPDLSEAES